MLVIDANEATPVLDKFEYPKMQVHKFGGTCLATASRISDAASHIMDTYRASGDQQMVVVSAMGSHITSPVKVLEAIWE